MESGRAVALSPVLLEQQTKSIEKLSQSCDFSAWIVKTDIGGFDVSGACPLRPPDHYCRSRPGVDQKVSLWIACLERLKLIHTHT